MPNLSKSPWYKCRSSRQLQWHWRQICTDHANRSLPSSLMSLLCSWPPTSFTCLQIWSQTLWTDTTSGVTSMAWFWPTSSFSLSLWSWHQSCVSNFGAVSATLLRSNKLGNKLKSFTGLLQTSKNSLVSTLHFLSLFYIEADVFGGIEKLADEM